MSPCLSNVTNLRTPEKKSSFSEGLRKVPRIWAVVAGGRVTRVFSKREDGISLVAEMKPEAKEESEENSAFAHEIAAWLASEAGRESFDRLVLVAALHVLGELRKAISHHVYVRIIAEVDRDLARMDEADMRAELGKILWF